VMLWYLFRKRVRVWCCGITLDERWGWCCGIYLEKDLPLPWASSPHLSTIASCIILTLFYYCGVISTSSARVFFHKHP
jgi:hypothetical protein